MTTPKKLLTVIEYIEHASFPAIYKQLGYDVTAEWQVRKAVSWLKKNQPDVIVADLYFQPDFRDRLSNLESLLAASHFHQEVKVLVFYEPANESVLNRVKERMRIDASIAMPVNEAELRKVLSGWL